MNEVDLLIVVPEEAVGAVVEAHRAVVVEVLIAVAEVVSRPSSEGAVVEVMTVVAIAGVEVGEVMAVPGSREESLLPTSLHPWILVHRTVLRTDWFRR